MIRLVRDGIYEVKYSTDINLSSYRVGSLSGGCRWQGGYNRESCAYLFRVHTMSLPYLNFEESYYRLKRMVDKSYNKEVLSG